MITWLAAAAFAALPVCLERPPDTSNAAVIRAAEVPNEEILARLAFAEGVSTGFPDDPLVYRAIAWGVMNRVRLAERSASAAAAYGRGIDGVTFAKGQFNPAISTRSQFSKLFLCPNHEARWALATAAATEALAGDDNPFVATDWERQHGLSLVVNFYYPRSVQARGPLAPWESSPDLVFIGDVALGDQTLPADRVRFYRRTSPPADVR